MMGFHIFHRKVDFLGCLVPSEEDTQSADIKMICEKFRILTTRFKSKLVHGFDWAGSQNLRKFRTYVQ
jgi:hypothetical protein